MKRVTLSILLLALLSGLLAACGGEAAPTATQVPATVAVPVDTPATGGSANPARPTAASNGDPHIAVQHILIGFKDAVGFQGNPPPKAATRTQEEAKTLAYDLLKRAKAGEDYDKLVADNTDDQAPGIYNLANTGVTPGRSDEYQREGMVPAFGNVGFGLKEGEIGIADYDPQTSPFGYHIIKRIQPKPEETKVVPNTTGQDQHITVQHILIGFKGSVPGKPITRTQEEAKTLAYDILKKAQGGEDFDALVKQYTDDSPPGIYGMSNIGVTPGTDEYARDRMVPAFGNVGFTLKVGEIGVADYDRATSPYGYHVIKRIK